MKNPFTALKDFFLYPHATFLMPKRAWHTNFTLTGNNFTDVNDLHCTKFYADKAGTDARILSVWTAPFFARLRFLFKGEINFIAYGTTHPPINMLIGEYFEKPKGPWSPSLQAKVNALLAWAKR
jgi:hypothetical protein